MYMYVFILHHFRGSDQTPRRKAALSNLCEQTERWWMARMADGAIGNKCQQMTQGCSIWSKSEPCPIFHPPSLACRLWRHGRAGNRTAHAEPMSRKGCLVPSVPQASGHTSCIRPAFVQTNTYDP